MGGDSALHQQPLRRGHRSVVGSAAAVPAIRQWQLWCGQRRHCEWLSRWRLRVQFSASQGAKKADRPLHHARHFYLGKNNDRRRQSSAGLRRHSQWRSSGLEKSAATSTRSAHRTSSISSPGRHPMTCRLARGGPLNLNGVSNAILGGWTMNAILYLSTGVPIASPTFGSNPSSYFNQRADMTCNPASGAPHTVAVWFTDNCFAVPGTEATGNLANANPFIPGTAPRTLTTFAPGGRAIWTSPFTRRSCLGKRKRCASMSPPITSPTRRNTDTQACRAS